MKGPALQLQHYLRARSVLTHREWFVLLALAAAHRQWVRQLQFCSHAGHRIDGAAARRLLRRLEQGGLVETRPAAAAAPPGAGGGRPTVEARITTKGMTFAGWPELAELPPIRTHENTPLDTPEQAADPAALHPGRAGLQARQSARRRGR